MVFPIVVQAVFRIAPIAVAVVKRYYKYESKLFNKAYKGINPGISYGVRHGYVAGSVIGSAFSPVDYGEAPSERKSDSVGKTRNKLVKSKSRRKYNYCDPVDERSNSSQRFNRYRRSYRS